jgi:hypothetical protein
VEGECVEKRAGRDGRVGGGRRAAGKSKGERRNMCRHIECVLVCASRCATTWPATEHILYGHIENT